MKKREKVAVVKCSSYEQKKVDKAVEKALKLINFKFERGKKVLIKPNVIGVFPKNQIAITTHPSLVIAICKILKKKKCKIFIGESSFLDTEVALKKSGIEKVAKKYGKLVVFEENKLVQIKDNRARVLKRFMIAKIVKDADLIINMPKLKTHVLTKYTGAIKNLYGLNPGGVKQRLHRKARGEKKFSKLLVDIYQNVKPELNIMDGIIGMEGHGPTSGKPKKANLILASKNSVALDIAACNIITLNPKRVYMVKEAVNRRLGSFKFELVGMKKLPKINFRKPRQDTRLSRLKRLFREKPIVVDEKKCKRCGLCSRKCPVHAITLRPYPIFDRKKCIRCYCCMEICPQHALSLKN